MYQDIEFGLKAAMADLYPYLTSEQLEGAAYNLEQYVELIGQIADRVDLDSIKDGE
jgi:hypothetical protein